MPELPEVGAERPHARGVPMSEFFACNASGGSRGASSL